MQQCIDLKSCNEDRLHTHVQNADSFDFLMLYLHIELPAKLLDYSYEEIKATSINLDNVTVSPMDAGACSVWASTVAGSDCNEY